MTTQRSTVEQSRQGVLELGCGEGDATQATGSEPLAANGQAVMVCQDNIEFMRGLPDASIKLIVTSPPYNLGKSYEERSPLDVYIQSQERVIAECVRLLAPSGSLCWQVGNYVNRGEVVPLDTVRERGPRREIYPLSRGHE